MITRLILAIGVIFFLATVVSAQQPKLDLKVYSGYHTHVFVYKEEEQFKDVLHGYQFGFGFRVSYRKLMGEMGYDFVRNIIRIPVDQSVGLEDDRVNVRVNALELPFKGGFIPVKTPLFKWYVYTGLGVRISTGARFDIDDEEFKLKPRELGLSNPNFDFLLGTQFDIAMINFEVLYRLGIDNTVTETVRTNSHEIHFNVGLLF